MWKLRPMVNLFVLSDYISKFANHLRTMRRTVFKYIFFGVGIIVFVLIILIYKILYNDNISPKRERAVLLIPTGALYNVVNDSLKANFKVKNWKVFDWVARRKNYPQLIKPGKYVFDHSLNYPRFVNILRSGLQTPVNLTFSNIRTINELAGRVGSQLEADSSQIIAFLNNSENYRKDDFTRESIISVFIPNTYELYWNTTPEGFYKRMLKEYTRFWNKERLAKAHEENLTRTEVAILASIVDDEVTKPDEKPRIAGVYINRLRKGMPLQACPTIKFALNDFTITRILTKQLQVNSPYNTYIHTGFPPGPIRCPSIEGLDAVLNAEKHEYLFFVAKADFSGYHIFSKTLAEHNKYSLLYQKELDKRKIFK